MGVRRARTRRGCRRLLNPFDLEGGAIGLTGFTVFRAFVSNVFGPVPHPGFAPGQESHDCVDDDEQQAQGGPDGAKPGDLAGQRVDATRGHVPPGGVRDERDMEHHDGRDGTEPGQLASPKGGDALRDPLVDLEEEDDAKRDQPDEVVVPGKRRD